jgi:hypothetical protein
MHDWFFFDRALVRFLRRRIPDFPMAGMFKELRRRIYMQVFHPAEPAVSPFYRLLRAFGIHWPYRIARKRAGY